LLFFNYVPSVIADVRLLPTFAGFLVEFVWGIIPVFVISTVCSWWFYRNNSTIGTGVIFNALLFAWTSVGVFPFGHF